MRYTDEELALLADAAFQEVMGGQSSEIPSASPDQNDSFLGDFADMAQRGALQGVGGLFSLAEEFTGYGQSGADYFAGWADEQLDTLSPEAQEALAKELFTRDASGNLTAGEGLTDLRTLGLNVAQGVGTIAPSLLGGGVGGLAGRALLAKRGADAASKAASVGRTAGFAGAGGGMAQGMAGEEAYSAVKSLDRETLYQSQSFLDLWNSDFYDEELSAEDNAERVIEELASDARSTVMRDPELAAVNFGSNLVVGKVFDGLLTGSLGKSRLGNAALSGTSEAAEEFSQEGMSALSVNEALREIDPTITDDNVLPQALTGAVVGLGVGTPMGLAGRVDQAREQAKASGKDPLEQELDAADAAASGMDEAPNIDPLAAAQQAAAEQNQAAVDDALNNAPQYGNTQPWRDFDPAAARERRQAPPTLDERTATAQQRKAERLSGETFTAAIRTLRDVGDTEGATQLETARGLAQRADALEKAGKVQMAGRLRQNAIKIYTDVMGVEPEPVPEKGGLPAETVRSVEGEVLTDTGLVPSQARRGETIDGELQYELPAPDAQGRIGRDFRRIGKDDVIYGAEPEDTRARREQKRAATEEALEGSFPEYDHTEINQRKEREALLKGQARDATLERADDLPAPSVDELRAKGLDERLASTDFRTRLNRMLGDLTEGGGISYLRDENDRVVGRTPSQNPAWFSENPDIPSKGYAEKAVKKALAGEKLGVKEQRAVASMLDAIEDERDTFSDPDTLAEWDSLFDDAKFRAAMDPDDSTPVDAWVPIPDAQLFDDGTNAPLRSVATLWAEARDRGIPQEDLEYLDAQTTTTEELGRGLINAIQQGRVERQTEGNPETTVERDNRAGGAIQGEAPRAPVEGEVGARGPTREVAPSSEPEIVGDTLTETTKADVAGETPERAPLIVARNLLDAWQDDYSVPPEAAERVGALGREIETALAGKAPSSSSRQTIADQLRDIANEAESDVAVELRAVASQIAPSRIPDEIPESSYPEKLRWKDGDFDRQGVMTAQGLDRNLERAQFRKPAEQREQEQLAADEKFRQRKAAENTGMDESGEAPIFDFKELDETNPQFLALRPSTQREVRNLKAEMRGYFEQDPRAPVLDALQVELTELVRADLQNDPKKFPPVKDKASGQTVVPHERKGDTATYKFPDGSIQSRSDDEVAPIEKADPFVPAQKDAGQDGSAPTLTKSGKPFKSEKMAIASAKRDGVSNPKAVPVEGGFGYLPGGSEAATPVGGPTQSAGETRADTGPEAKSKAATPAGRPSSSDGDQNAGRAKAGGEYGVNGEWYEGGQILPSSKHTVKGAHKVGSGQKGSGRVLVAPGELEVAPEGGRPIFARIQHFVEPDGKGGLKQKRGIESDTLKHFGYTPAKLSAEIKRFNQGERYIFDGGQSAPRAADGDQNADTLIERGGAPGRVAAAYKRAQSRGPITAEQGATIRQAFSGEAGMAEFEAIAAKHGEKSPAALMDIVIERGLASDSPNTATGGSVNPRPGANDSPRSESSANQETKPITLTGDDLDAGKIERAYSHSVRNARGMVQLEREQYTSFIDGLRNDLGKDLPEGNEQALEDGLQRIASEYVRRRDGVLNARSGVTSSFIAGRNNFNKKQTDSRGNSVDRAEADFSQWMKSETRNLANDLGVSGIRAARAAALAEKKAKAKVAAEAKLKEMDKAESERKRKLPIINDSGAEITMTKAEWAKESKDYKTISANDNYRYRLVMRQGGMKTVYISDMKEVAKSTFAESPKAEASTRSIPAKPADGYSHDHHREILNAIVDGGETVSVDEVKAAFESMVADPEATKNLLNKLTIKQLTPIARPNFSGMKKAELVDMAFKEMLMDYEWLTVHEGVMQRTGGYDTDSRIAAARERLEGLTAKDLKQYSDDRKAAIEERKNKITAFNKALKNPETLEEFEQFIKYKGREALSAEQLKQYDAMKAGKTIEEMEAEKAAKAVKAGLDVDDELDINPIEEGVHGKTGEPIFNVSLKTRLGSEKFKEAAGMARSMKGGYWRGNFYFKSREDAELFTGWLQGEAVDRSEKFAERAADKVETRVARLRELADKTEAKASEKLNADRKTNTARRARMANSAEESAAKEIEYARILRNVADAVEAGEAPFLANLSATTQLSELLSIKRQAPTKEHRNDPNYDGYSSRQGDLKEGVTIDDYAHLIEMPRYTMHGEQAAELGRDISNIAGLKRLGEQLVKEGSRAKGKIAISPDGVAKIKAKVGRYYTNKYGRREKFAMPWQLERQAEQIGRLERMGIATGEHLRSAIRELDAIEQNSEKVKRDPLKDKERALVGKKIPGFFPTPEIVVEQLIDAAGIEPGMKVLEPSAGKGDIADAIKESSPDAELDIVEFDPSLRELLEAKGYTPAGRDFLEHEGAYDRIVMNPPFEKNADIAHVRHAYSLLKPGGRLVAVMSGPAGFRQDTVNREFKEWVDGLDGVMDPLPEGSFRSSFRPTGVNTQMVVIEKPEVDFLASRSSQAKSGAIPRGVSKGAARIAVNQFLKQYKGADDVKVEIHDSYRSAFGEEAPFRTKGGYALASDTLYLFTGELDSISDLRETIQHELLVHKGLGLFDPKLVRAFVNSIRATAKDSPQLADIVAEVESVEAGKSEALKGEEILARIAQERLSLPDKLWNKLVLAVQRLLRSIGFTVQSSAYRRGKDLIYRMGDAFMEGKRARRRNESDVMSSQSAEVVSEASADDGPGSTAWERAKAKGLDMSKEARMERARAMGFDTSERYYHGTVESFDEFVPTDLDAEDAANILPGGTDNEVGVFVARDREDAAFFAGEYEDRVGRTGYEEGANVIPVFLRWEGERVKEYPDQESFIRDINENYYDAKSYRQSLIDEGYQAVRVAKPDLRMEGRDFSQWMVVLDPSNIRSVNAAFDPGESDSANLLFSRTAEPAPERAAVLEKVGLAPDTRSMADRIKDTVKETWREVTEAFVPAVADKFHDLNRISKDAYMRARMSTNTGATLAAALAHATPEWHESGILKAKADSKGLLDILKEVDGETNEWLGWMVGKRAERLSEQDRENLLTDDDIATLLDVTPEQRERFERTAEQWREYNGAMLDLMVGGNLLSADAAARFKEDPYYIPFYREIMDETGEIDVAAPFTKRGLSHQKHGIEMLKGGSSNLQDPLKNMLMNVTRAIDASVKNNALLRIVDQVGGNADILTPAGEGNRSGKNVIRVKRGGESEFYRVHDAGILGALTSMGDMESSALTKVLGMPKRLLTAGVTATPTFMIRNAIRDITAAWMQSEDVKYQAGKAMGHFKAALKIDSDLVDLMMAGGAFMGGYRYSNDATSNAQALREQLRAKGMSTEAVDGYMSSLWDGSKRKWEWYREKGERFENMSRLKLFKDAKDDGRDYFEAAYRAKDLMDFSLHGRNQIMHFLIQTVPFMNARIQGLYKLGRVAGNQKNMESLRQMVAFRGAMLAAATLALYGMNEDDERYQELPEWDKDANWHFFFDDEHIRIPRPFELGLIFSTLPERAARLANGDDDGRTFFRSLATNLTETLSMNPIPQAAMPMLEASLNYDTFRRRPIDNLSDQGNLPEARYSNYTSELAKAMGAGMAALGMEGDMASPKRIDHIIKGYTGSMGIALLNGVDGVIHMLNGKTMPAMNERDYPVVGWFSRGNDPAGTKYSEEFYTLLSRANKAYRTYRDPMSDSEYREDILEEYGPELRARKMLGSTSRRLNQIRKQIDAIYQDDSMSREKKRERINRLQSMMNEMQRRAVEATERAGG